MKLKQKSGEGMKDFDLRQTDTTTFLPTQSRNVFTQDKKMFGMQLFFFS